MFLIKFLYYFNDMFLLLNILPLFEISNLIIYEIYVSYNQMLRPIGIWYYSIFNSGHLCADYALLIMRNSSWYANIAVAYASAVKSELCAYYAIADPRYPYRHPFICAGNTSSWRGNSQSESANFDYSGSARLRIRTRVKEKKSENTQKLMFKSILVH